LTAAIASKVYHDFLFLKVLIDIDWTLAVHLLDLILNFGHHVLLSQMVLLGYFHESWSKI
jgi:hypothetical protein